MATQADLDRLATSKGRDAEVLWLQLMVAHHRGGVAMAEVAVNRIDRPAVRQLAQSIVDARRVEFMPSADHSRLDANGTPIVNAYTMTIYNAGGTTPVRTVNLGKPTPASDGALWLERSPAFERSWSTVLEALRGAALAEA